MTKKKTTKLLKADILNIAQKQCCVIQAWNRRFYNMGPTQEPIMFKEFALVQNLGDDRYIKLVSSIIWGSDEELKECMDNWEESE